MEEDQNSIPPVSNPPSSALPISESESNLPTPPPSNIGQKTSKFSIKAIISTIIFLLLAGGAAAGYVYREPILKLVTNSTPTPTVILSQSKDPSPTPDPTAEWLTYSGDSFSFKYPKNLQIIEAATESSNLKSLRITSKNSSESALSKREVSISTEDNSSSLRAEEYWKNYVKQNNHFTHELSEPYRLNELDAIQVEGVGLDHVPIKTILVATTNYAYFLKLYELSEEQINNDDTISETLFDQILSTFKLTN